MAGAPFRHSAAWTSHRFTSVPTMRPAPAAPMQVSSVPRNANASPRPHPRQPATVLRCKLGVTHRIRDADPQPETLG